MDKMGAQLQKGASEMGAKAQANAQAYGDRKQKEVKAWSEWREAEVCARQCVSVHMCLLMRAAVHRIGISMLHSSFLGPFGFSSVLQPLMMCA